MTLTTEGTLLGKNVEVLTHYNKEVLVRVPRAANREQYGITNDQMYGCDLWRAYEFSTLNSKGAPIYLMLEICYPSDSLYIVESKSLKLYLNSFNMDRQEFADRDLVIKEVFARISSDLSGLLECIVGVSETSNRCKFNLFDFQPLTAIIAFDKIECSKYDETPDILKNSPILAYRSVKWTFDGFRSNCKVTHAPDYATVFVEYRGEYGIDPESLFQYLTSFRNENHFHEECCEVIFHRLRQKFAPLYLNVSCFYTRRGGIDINPVRSTEPNPLIPCRTIFQ